MSQERNSMLHRELQDKIKRALKQWNANGRVTASPIEYLEVVKAMQRAADNSMREAAQQVISQALQSLSLQHPDESEMLRCRYIDGNSPLKLAHKYHLAQSTIFRKLQSGLEHLTEGIVQLEQQSGSEWQQTQLHRLPAANYTHLIGLQEHLEKLFQQLTSDQPPWILSIEGLGGLGKTTLADALARRLTLEKSDMELAWITAKQQIFNLGGSISEVPRPILSAELLIEALFSQLVGQRPASYSFNDMLNALAQRMHRFRHIIFIDNLETVTDVDVLLPTLRRLVNPSRIVLTTRHSLLGEADIFHFSLPTLSEAHTLQLVRFEAQQRNLPHVATASDSELCPIYERVGGNPLAIRLVVGQLHVHALDTVLADLLEVRADEASALYSYIYRRAWEHLDETERQTLLAMPMVPHSGGTLEYLTAITEMEPNDLQRTLHRLVSINLVDVRSHLHQPRYSIHSLTRSFLHRQVALWQT